VEVQCELVRLIGLIPLSDAQRMPVAPFALFPSLEDALQLVDWDRLELQLLLVVVLGPVSEQHRLWQP